MSSLGGCAKDEPPWDATSQSIDVTCGSFFEGSMEFHAKRSELSEAQLGLLDQLRATDGKNGCPEDVRSCDVVIVDGSGSEHVYAAYDGDGTCNRESELIAYDSLDPFLKTVPCQFGKLAGKDALAANAQCMNGMFSPNDGTTVHEPLAIAEANRAYHIELDDCSDPTRLGQVGMHLEVDGKLVQGNRPEAPGADRACLELDFTPTQTGTLDLVVTTSPSFGPGDYWMQFR